MGAAFPSQIVLSIKISWFSHTGAGGVGKSTALKHLALAWANGTSKQLKCFDFVFHVALRYVEQGQTLEEAIVMQHQEHTSRKVPSSEIRSILEGPYGSKVLLLLDGYDEYEHGRSKSVDEAIIRDSLPDCTVLLTSRDTDKLIQLRHHMDVEAEIKGFDPKRVREYITKFLGSTEKCEELLSVANSRNVINRSLTGDKFGIMQIPILLHMICVLFLTKVSLPKTMTGIYEAVADRCADWEAVKQSGTKTIHKDMKKALDEALVKLGKLSWQRLKENNKDLIFSKVNQIKCTLFSAGLSIHLTHVEIGQNLVAPKGQEKIDLVDLAVI